MKAIVLATRKSIGSFGGSLALFSATHSGAAAIQSAVQKKSDLKPGQIQEVFLVNVL